MQDIKNISVIGHVNPVARGFAITLDPRFRDGLIGLQGFSHAIVLWWASATDSEEHRGRLIYKKPYANNPNDVGVFGSRSPSRPNPIGLSVIALQDVDIENAAVFTPYIDTEIATPVIDIKPYFAASDLVRSCVYPEWCSHWPNCFEESADFDWAKEFN